MLRRRDDVFVFDGSPLEDEKQKDYFQGDDDSDRFPPSWASVDMPGAVNAYDLASGVKVAYNPPEPFVLPYYNSVLQKDMNGTPSHYVKVCNQCGAVVHETYEYQHNEHHRKVHERLEEAARPRYVVGLDPAEGSGFGLSGAPLLRSDSDSQASQSGPTASRKSQSSDALQECERGTCTHLKRDHALGNPRRCLQAGCECKGFMLLPF